MNLTLNLFILFTLISSLVIGLNDSLPSISSSFDIESSDSFSSINNSNSTHIKSIGETYFIIFRTDVDQNKVSKILHIQKENSKRAKPENNSPRVTNVFDLPMMRGFSLQIADNPQTIIINNILFLNEPPNNSSLLIDSNYFNSNPSLVHPASEPLPPFLTFLEKYRSLILFIERNAPVKMQSTYYVQYNAPPNLCRISERYKSLNQKYYLYNLFAGSGVDCYVIDSGVNVYNQEFGGRASMIVDFTNEGFVDNQGHGSHVAGIIGGSTYGVAKRANILGVKIIGKDGYSDWSTVIAALNWIYLRVKKTVKNSVINLSIGGPTSLALSLAIKSLNDAGIIVVAAAGNDYKDACQSSPGSSPDAIIVAGTNMDDTFLTESNYGSCVDILAPGSYIKSAYSGGTSATAYMTGTSMACPHVVGALALLWSANPSWPGYKVKSTLLGSAMMNQIYYLPSGTPNKFLYSL